MAKPVIETTQSVLAYLQHEEFQFQPTALNNPTAWSTGALPPGLTLNAGTGRVSGAITKVGVWNVHFFASNADGVSAPVKFTFATRPSVQNPNQNVIDVTIDLGTCEVTVYGSTQSDQIIFTRKYLDDVIFRVQFRRGGVAASMTLTDLKCVIKADEPDAVLAESTAFSAPVGGFFLVYLPLTDEKIAGALADKEGRKWTSFEALCEFKWVETNTLGVGPTDRRGSSQIFLGKIVRNLTP